MGRTSSMMPAFIISLLSSIMVAFMACTCRAARPT